jgi:hypothetical protein
VTRRRDTASINEQDECVKVVLKPFEDGLA